jgi:hypothetical protein
MGHMGHMGRRDDRGWIAPATPMMGIGAPSYATQIPLALLVLLSLNVLMMMVCAIALFWRGGRSG